MTHPMKRAAWFAMLIGLTACAAPELNPPPSDQIARDAANVIDPGQIVALVPGEAAAARLATRARQQGYVLLRQDDLASLGFRQLVFRIPRGRDGPTAIAELEAIERSATAGVNHAYRLQAEPGGRVYADRLLDWSSSGCAARLPVGIIDGAVDSGAAELRNARIVQKDFTGGHPAAVEHGTAVAEIIAGPGRLTGAQIYSASVVSDAPEFDEAAGVDTLMRAIDWLAASGVRLVNVSLAGPYNKILDRGLQAADRKGMVVIAAAGNVGPSSPPRYPAAFSQTIAVTAIDAAMRPYDLAPRGAHIDFAAPGVDIYLELDGQGKYLSGTSLAAPYVTALVAGEGAAGSVSSVRHALSGNARDLGEKGPDAVFGNGLPRPGGACRKG
ncbi:S8 family serine peptidase [Paracoccus sp. MBLB3053]|uniref:S8 family serine peptidase n=1 Tax=Paracoccus aurantius TaxID=3073814 RepID=A0ABU2HY27_9RHOB|nr:S8 family serine peptidase [Paracoccus sp. MBLB3053]MDS9469961.1 S8 family serine peptidase [Paracoccus sp. MBLB3053]